MSKVIMHFFKSQNMGGHFRFKRNEALTNFQVNVRSYHCWQHSLGPGRF